ncbi:MAG TPA: class I SAM-dependent methyltransferase [Gemmatimonadaceae bacterium]
MTTHLSAPPRARASQPSPARFRPSRSTSRVVASTSLGHDEYVAFGNVEARNGLQERIEIPLLIRALGLPRGGRVLEVGCGRGIALPVLAHRLEPDTLTGIDIDAKLVALANARVERSRVAATVRQADVRALPFGDESFDLVIDFGTCYHVSGGEAGSRAALEEIARVLRPGGLFAHETPIAQHLAHPVRSFGRSLPWADVPTLERNRAAGLWATRTRGLSCGGVD